MKRNTAFLLFMLCVFALQAQNSYRTDKDISYILSTETDAYRKERCKLDVYYPTDKKNVPTIVWLIISPPWYRL